MGDTTWTHDDGQVGAEPASEGDRRRSAALQHLDRAGARVCGGATLTTTVLERLADIAETPVDQLAHHPQAQALLDNEARSLAAPASVPGPTLWQRWRSRPRKRLPWAEAARRADQDLSGR